MKRWTSNEILRLNYKFEAEEPAEILRWIYEEFGSKAVMGTGFGPAGIMLLDIITQNNLNFPVFYLDTDHLFEETYKLRDQLEDFFDLSFDRVCTSLSIEEQAIRYGDELWKKNPNECCYLRKVLPLKNYLSDKKAWITGIRRHQSNTRLNTKIIQWDPFNEVWKLNPLANWSSEELWNYINANKLPYNILHDNGYPSIGCEPCTNPVGSGEHERAGRWAGMNKTECGIHIPTQEEH
jgi:phosphoadenosine phosphosulfate reductase